MNMLLLCLVLVGLVWAKSLEPEECSRAVSRKVRRYLKKDILPALKGTELPANCPLNPMRDLYHDHELHKQEIDRDEWKCNYCNKRFVNEFYLDRHLSLHHADNLTASSPVCLAELCPIFGCRQKQPDQADERVDMGDNYHHVIPRSTFHRLERCTADKLTAILSTCHSVADSCFVNEEQRAGFVKKVCANLKCTRGVLEGGIREEAVSADIVWRILRYMLVFVVLVVACMQASLAGQAFSWLTSSSSSRGAGRRDLLGAYASSKGAAGRGAGVMGWIRARLYTAEKNK